MLFKKILDNSNRKPNKIWVSIGNEFYNGSMKSWLHDNNIEMYSTHNEGKSVIVKLYKYMNLISKNEYIDKLDDTVNKSNNKFYSTIKMKSVDVKSSTYNDFDKKINKEGSKFSW